MIPEGADGAVGENAAIPEIADSADGANTAIPEIADSADGANTAIPEIADGTDGANTAIPEIADGASRRVAEHVTVVTDEGNRYPGWVILPDVVLVRGLRRVEFCPTVRVERGGAVFSVRELVDSAAGTPASRRGVALVLPGGSIPLDAGAPSTASAAAAPSTPADAAGPSTPVKRTGLRSAAPPGVQATEEDWRAQFAALPAPPPRHVDP